MLADIAIDIPLRTTFTYEVPATLQTKICRGGRVLVPFGKKNVIGFCLALKEQLSTSQKSLTPKQLKEITSVIDEQPLLDENYLRWLELAADYYFAPIGSVFAQAVPSYFSDFKKINKLIKPRAKKITQTFTLPQTDIQLTDTQSEITEAISQNLSQFYPTLIQGITGSGKTEIYIQLIKRILALGKSAIYLVPEIGLTPQITAKLAQHFKDKLLIYHSGLTPNQKLDQWQKCLSIGEPLVMIGTRSALFAPFKNLGLIIIDEEQDGSYKQEDRFRYHARDLAVLRGKLLKIPVVLGSATPSLETYFLAQKKQYHYFALNQRFGNAKLPKIEIIDIQKEKEQTNLILTISQKLHDAITYHLKRYEQIMIFVGQRGYAQNAFCTKCSQIQICPNCSVGLKFHKVKNELKCHYCDYILPFSEVCSVCHVKGLTLLGFGSQTIEEEIRTFHPKARVARVDSDVLNAQNKLETIFENFNQHRIDILIGTQMIAKGHDFKNVGLVGVIGIDAHLGLPDFRASERSFQTLVQVAGRAGRADKLGQVLVQSYMPTHVSLVLGSQYEYQKFAEAELNLRRELNYPPYTRLIEFRFVCNQEERLVQFFKEWRPFLKKLQAGSENKKWFLLGPTQMAIPKVRGKFRYHMLIKLNRGLKARDLIEYIVSEFETKNPSGIVLQVDVDPISF